MNKFLLAGLLLLSFTSLAFFTPTNYTVTGKVTDDQGKPIAGASVVVKGTRQGTATDTAGNFSITLRTLKATLVISAVGLESREIKVGKEEKLLVKLQPSKANLEEVVVVGYSAQRKMDITSSVASISSPQLNIGYVLAGRAAGLNVSPDYEYYNGHYNIADTERTQADFSREGYDHIVENRFLRVTDNPLSTFSIDVDAASYSNVRRFLQNGSLPPAGAVRIEELVNYFKYDYPQPTGKDPFSINTEIGACPWNAKHQLVMVGLQGKNIPTENLPASNIVFLIDVSGSMESPDKLPLVKASLKLLVDQLREQDKVSLVVYAGAAGTVLPATSGANKAAIRKAIDNLNAGGSTAGGEGIKLAYKTAKENFVVNCNNRVILCTDGDFNVGVSSDDELESLIEKERESGVFLSIAGFGTGNYQDAKMQKLADKGNGNHSYIDGLSEARKVFVSEFGGTLFTIAKDVKLQIEFNPTQVQGYRLIGYENRLLNKEDFNNDKKDAGELGSGHTVTALYEIIPFGVTDTILEKVDKLKYQQPLAINNGGTELMTIKFRYKQPDENVSQLITHTVSYSQKGSASQSDNFQFAAAVAQFGLLLRQSEFKQNASWANVLKLAQSAKGKDAEGYRSEFVRLIKDASAIAQSGDEDDDEDVSIR